MGIRTIIWGMMVPVVLSACGGDDDSGSVSSPDLNLGLESKISFNNFPLPASMPGASLSATSFNYAVSNENLYVPVDYNGKDYVARLELGSAYWNDMAGYEHLMSIFVFADEMDNQNNSVVLAQPVGSSRYMVHIGGDAMWIPDLLDIGPHSYHVAQTSSDVSDYDSMYLMGPRGDYRYAGSNAAADISKRSDSMTIESTVATRNAVYSYNLSKVYSVHEGIDWNFSDYGLLLKVLVDDYQLWAVTSEGYVARFIETELSWTIVGQVNVPSEYQSLMSTGSAYIAQDDWYIYFPGGIAFHKLSYDSCQYLNSDLSKDASFGIDYMMKKQAFLIQGVMAAEPRYIYTTQLTDGKSTLISANILFLAENECK
ncbi:hypothetical protein GT360_06785 [Vibrio astriarenae]|uniref:Uncharacterized protein n=1 Tax=Vibrio astriarenae TaxID=1481923 RepID=A0A7Z2T2S8_9VIBR|nr:hypothetical protein [Vibrio astriarenae]QIA63237.1 hypothetical protein GT360_06785 [Vibrio astriarenae]